MLQRLEATFLCGKNPHRLIGERDQEGGLRLTILDDTGGELLQELDLKPEETVALCVVLNGLGEDVPWMVIPETKQKEAAIGFHYEPAEDN